MFPKWFKFLVVLALIGVIVGFLGTIFTESMNDVVEGQLKKLRENRITEAYYDFTSKEFQATTTLEVFREFITLYPVLSENKTFIFGVQSTSKEIGNIKGMLISKELHEMKVEFHLVKEENQWKILSIRLKESRQADQEETATLELIERVDEQLKALRKNDVIDAYYGFVSKDFQKETPLQVFREFINANPILFNYRGVNFKDRSIENGRGYVNLILNSESGDYYLEYNLMREGGEWKIWSLRIILPPEEAAKKAATDPQALVPPVRALLDAFSLENIRGAYDSTAREFQDVTSYESFESFVTNYPVFIRRDLVDIKTGLIENGVGKLRVNLHNDAGMTVIEFRLGFEEDQWKVWGMQIVEQPEVEPDNSMEPIEEKGSRSLSERALADRIQDVIQAQLIALRHQDFSTAYYNYTTEKFRENHSLQRFEHYLMENPEFTQYHSSQLNRLSFHNNLAILRGTMTSFDNRTYPIKYELIRENGSWRINNFVRLPEEEPVAESEILLDKPPVASPKTLELFKLYIGTEIDDQGLIEDPVKVIDSNVNSIYINVHVKNGIANTLVTFTLEHVDSASTTPPLSTMLEKDGDSIISFSYAAPTLSWPEGDYIAKVTTSLGQEIFEKFEMQAQ